MEAAWLVGTQGKRFENPVNVTLGGVLKNLLSTHLGTEGNKYRHSEACRHSIQVLLFHDAPGILYYSKS